MTQGRAGLVTHHVHVEEAGVTDDSPVVPQVSQGVRGLGAGGIEGERAGDGVGGAEGGGSPGDMAILHLWVPSGVHPGRDDIGPTMWPHKGTASPKPKHPSVLPLRAAWMVSPSSI